jgi:hypothetical protein
MSDIYIPYRVNEENVRLGLESRGVKSEDIDAALTERKTIMNTSTDLQDLEERQNIEARLEAREERLPLDVLAQASNQMMLEIIHIFGGYPGKDGTEWTSQLVASSFLRTMQWKISDLETKKLPKAMQALEAAIVSEGVPEQLEDEWNEATGRFETPDAAYASMMPESKVERCEAWVLGLEEQYDCLQAAYQAALPAFEATFGQYVKASAKNRAITAASNPRLAALQARMNQKMKPGPDQQG